MCLSNDVPQPPAAGRRPRLKGLLAGLALVLSVHAVAADFDARPGRRMLGAALASSATELSQGREISTPRTPEQLLLMFLVNPRYNAYLWKHPEVMPHLMDQMAEPGFLVAMYQTALHPEAYLHFLEGWTDIEKLRSYFEMMDPAVMLAWAGAMSSPAFYVALFAPMAEPRKYQAWAAFMMGSRLPDFAAPLLDPQTYLTWLTLPLNPALMSHLQGPLRLLNPARWFGMAGTAMDSGNQAVQRFAAPDGQAAMQASR